MRFHRRKETRNNQALLVSHGVWNDPKKYWKDQLSLQRLKVSLISSQARSLEKVFNSPICSCSGWLEFTLHAKGCEAVLSKGPKVTHTLLSMGRSCPSRTCLFVLFFVLVTRVCTRYVCIFRWQQCWVWYCSIGRYAQWAVHDGKTVAPSHSQSIHLVTQKSLHCHDIGVPSPVLLLVYSSCLIKILWRVSEERDL